MRIDSLNGKNERCERLPHGRWWRAAGATRVGTNCKRCSYVSGRIKSTPCSQASRAAGDPKSASEFLEMATEGETTTLSTPRPLSLPHRRRSISGEPLRDATKKLRCDTRSLGTGVGEFDNSPYSLSTPQMDSQKYIHDNIDH